MRRILPEVVIVVVEITDQRAVDQRRQRARCFRAVTDRGGFRIAAELLRHITHYRGGFAAKTADGAGQRIEYDPPGRDYDLRRQILVADTVYELRKPVFYEGDLVLGGGWIS